MRTIFKQTVLKSDVSDNWIKVVIGLKKNFYERKHVKPVLKVHSTYPLTQTFFFTPITRLKRYYRREFKNKF